MKKAQKNIVLLLIYVLIGLAAYKLHGIYPVFPYPDWIVGIAVPVLILSIVIIKSFSPKKYRKNVEYGSARWGKSKDIKPYTDPDPMNNIILTQTESLTMNSRPSKPKYARNKNVMVIGGSGSGKTRFFVKPNIMQCQSKKHRVSFVVTDPKGVRPDRA